MARWSNRLRTGWRSLTIGLSVFANWAAADLAAQAPAGSIHGSLIDEHGRPVPHAVVTVSSSALEEPRRSWTGADGEYLFRSLSPGHYHITFRLAGAGQTTRMVDVPPDGTVEEDAVLRRSQGLGPPAPLAAARAGVYELSSGEIERLPSAALLAAFAALVPGVNDRGPNSGQIVIGGAFAFDNAFVMNGADITGSLFGAPEDLLIRDALARIVVHGSGIDAAYGRFSGGVVEAITKSGSEAFSGTFRTFLSNRAWPGRTSLDAAARPAAQSPPGTAHEATAGGPIARGALWYFAAGHLSRVSADGTLIRTTFPYVETDRTRRGEIKITAAGPGSSRAQFGYLWNYRVSVDRPAFPFSIDPFTLARQESPASVLTGSYGGAIGRRTWIDLLVARRGFALQQGGSQSGSIVDSPFLTLFGEPGHYNAPYFDPTDPDRRASSQIKGQAAVVLNSRGRHEIRGGYERFSNEKRGGNSQSLTGYVLDADYADDPSGRPRVDAAGHLIPLFVPGNTLLEHWMAVRGSTLDAVQDALYVQDRSTAGRLSLDAGLRYERTMSSAAGRLDRIAGHAAVPRLAASYPFGTDGLRIAVPAGYARYAGRYGEAQMGAGSSVGQPDVTIAVYDGAPGQGRSFLAGFVPANYRVVSGFFPSANVRLDPRLSTPTTSEVTWSVTASASRADAQVIYIRRRTKHVIEDFIDLSNGVTSVQRDGASFGPFTNIVFRNSDLAARRYQALVMQGRRQIRPDWKVEGAWTIQLENDGNFEGEAPNRPGMPSWIGNFPGAFDPARTEPGGRLSSFERHRIRAWSIAGFPLGRRGKIWISGVLSLDSGRAYSLVAANQPLTAIQKDRLTSYPDPPFSQPVYFGPRGAHTFPGSATIDTSITFEGPRLGGLQPSFTLDAFNVLNRSKPIGFNTAVIQDPAAPKDALGLSTRFLPGPAFGQPASPRDFPSPRTFRLAAGVRF